MALITLLKIIATKKEISDDQYQFIISKISNKTNQKVILEQVLGNQINESKFKRKALSFKRDRESKTEDFDKEFDFIIKNKELTDIVNEKKINRNI